MKNFLLLLVFFLQACTISFTNVSTHGQASDLVDEQQTASPDIQAEVPLIK